MIEESTFDIEDMAAKFGAMMAAREACNWSGGDFVNRVLDHYNDTIKDKRERRAERKRFFGLCTMQGRFTSAHVYQLAKVSGTWVNEQRYPDLPWSLYRATMNAAKRIGRDPRELIDEVRRDGLSVADLNAMGKVIGLTLELDHDCPACGVVTKLRVEGQRAADARLHELVPRCPVCVMIADREGREWQEAPPMGALA